MATRGSFSGTTVVPIVPAVEAAVFVAQIWLHNADSAARTITLAIRDGLGSSGQTTHVSEQLAAGSSLAIDTGWQLEPGWSVVGWLDAAHATTAPTYLIR